MQHNQDYFNYINPQELQIGNSQCDFCIYYNKGKRTDICPSKQLDAIINDEIKCPHYKDSNIF